MGATQRYAVIGGGIVGLAVAERIARTRPGGSITVIEKEATWAAHQTGRNSGVIHSGLYYKPGSHKAVMCRAGAESMRRFALDEGIKVEQCGKLVVASTDSQLGQLRALADRGRQNGLAVRELDPTAAREIEPHVACVAALHVPETGIVDYRGVCAALVRRLADAGASLRLSTRVLDLHQGADTTTVVTSAGEVTADAVINCAGLHSDRIAKMTRSGRRDVRIIPFRGEYYELNEQSQHLVRGLIYPVPDPLFPFLGVHLTRMVDGGVHAGPNAVLALAREGYQWRTVRPRDVADTLTFGGFWRLAGRHGRAGADEIRRSLSRHRFADSLRALVPAIRDEDLVPSVAGVRAQAVRRDGTLVDDFLIERDGRTIHVVNAPSPAATASLEIATHIESLLPVAA